MRTVLPLPDQEGFALKLPTNVKFAHGTSVSVSEVGELKATRNDTTFIVKLPPRAGDALIAAMHEDGDGLETSGLAVTWTQLVERLGAAGFLVDGGDYPPGFVGGLTAVTEINDAIFRFNMEFFQGDHRFVQFIAGTLTQAAAKNWIVENYKYTKSATVHISPVLSQPMSEWERGIWDRFLQDESWHWSIYKPAFRQFGLDWRTLDDRPAQIETLEFVEALRTAAGAGAVEYAAVMMFIERPPTVWHADEDPLFIALRKNYDLSEDSIKPLWWHATENLHAGHSALGAIVITNREKMTRETLDSALAHVRAVIDAVSNWQNAILARDFVGADSD